MTMVFGALFWCHDDTVMATWYVHLQNGQSGLSPFTRLLVRRGRLSAVIDFGCLGVGDPACDLQVAWNLFSTQRDVFHAALLVDDATWARGRGWALSVGVIALPYYQRTNPVLAGIARHAIDEVLTDQKGK